MAAEKEDDMLTIMEELITRYPQLGVCRGEVEEACADPLLFDRT